MKSNGMKSNGSTPRRVFLLRSTAAVGGMAVFGYAGAGELDDARAAWEEDPDHRDAVERGKVYSDCATNARRLLQGWMDRRQCLETALFSRGGEWDYHNQGADYYSSLVLIAHYVHPLLNEVGGRLHNTMVSYRERCLKPNGIPTRYNLKEFRRTRPATFGELAEFLKDALIRIVEVKGDGNIWYDELVALTNAMLAEAENRGGVVRAFGRDNFPAEENVGNMLQTVSRLFVMTGNEPYLDVAETLAEHWLEALLADEARIMFTDHGGELIAGLGEWFVVESRYRPKRAARHRGALAKVLDYVKDQYTHPETGLLVKSQGRLPPDCWGYTLFAYENYDLATGEGRYTDFLERPLRWLLENRGRYAEVRRTLWPRSRSSDDWSDSYESFMHLWNRHRLEGGFAWLDWATRQHIHRQGAAYADVPPERMRGLFGHLTAPGDPGVAPEYGPYLGRHFDGSTGRCLLTHMLLAAEGVYGEFHENLRLGGVKTDAGLLLTAACKGGYRGKLYFDSPRFARDRWTLDWARINSMPEWFAVDPERWYQVARNGDHAVRMRGRELIDGLRVTVADGTILRLTVTECSR